MAHVHRLAPRRLVVAGGEQPRVSEAADHRLGLRIHGRNFGLDHGVGHFLLLLYDAKAPRGQNSKYFSGLGHSYSSTSVSLLKIITKYPLFITI